MTVHSPRPIEFLNDMASAHSTEIELARYTQQSEASLGLDAEQDEYVHEADLGFSLPPTDGGKDAWLFLFACFMLEGLIWGMHSTRFESTSINDRTGFAASYGIFQDYYSTHEPFSGSGNIAVVGACAMVCTHIFV